MNPQVGKRRTTCGYCGARISGATEYGERWTYPERVEYVKRAARFTCLRHRWLPRNDPNSPLWNISA